jgi:hypothetical protein
MAVDLLWVAFVVAYIWTVRKLAGMGWSTDAPKSADAPSDSSRIGRVHPEGKLPKDRSAGRSLVTKTRGMSEMDIVGVGLMAAPYGDAGGFRRPVSQRQAG